MEHLKLFMRHLLVSIFLNVFSQKLKISLVNFHWHFEIIFNYFFIYISYIRAQYSDALCALKILAAVYLFNCFFYHLTNNSRLKISNLQNFWKHLSKPFQIPILIDNSRNNSIKEYIVSLLCKEIHEIVHFAYFFVVSGILLAPLGNYLLCQKIY